MRRMGEYGEVELGDSGRTGEIITGDVERLCGIA